MITDEGIENLIRAIFEIHNRLGEIVMLLQVVALAQRGQVNFSDDFLSTLLKEAASIAFKGEMLTSPTLSFLKD